MHERIPFFRENLKKYWLKSGLTIEELSEKSGISLTSLKKYLYSDHKDPRVSTMIRLAVALDCTVNDLIGYRKGKKQDGSERVLLEIKELLEEHFRCEASDWKKKK